MTPAKGADPATGHRPCRAGPGLLPAAVLASRDTTHRRLFFPARFLVGLPVRFVRRFATYGVDGGQHNSNHLTPFMRKQPLTPMETKVVRLVSLSCTTPQVANILGVA